MDILQLNNYSKQFRSFSICILSTKLKITIMKKIYLLAAVLITATSVSQENLASAGYEIANPITVSRNATAQADCTTEITVNVSTSGFGNLNTNEVGDNFMVPEGTFFEITDARVFIISNNTTVDSAFDNLIIRFYESGGEFPTTLISEDVIAAPTFTDGGAVNGALNLIQLEFTLNNSVILEAPDGDTEFWFTIFIPESTSADNFLETTEAGGVGTTLAAFKAGDDPDGVWANSFVNNAGNVEFLDRSAVFSLDGDCDALLSVDDSALDTGILLFPNPTNSVININFTRNLGATTIDLINVNGQKVLSTSLDGFGNKTLSVSTLSTGIYFAQIVTEDGRSTTIKVIKS